VKFSAYTHQCLIGSILIGWILIFGQCTFEPSSKNIERSAEYLEGEALAKVHCVACHQYTDPSWLNKSSWIQVLSAMDHEMKQSNYKIPYQDWLTIQRFYRNEAMPNITRGNTKKPTHSRLFTSKLDDMFGGSKLGNISVIKAEQKTLFAADVLGNIEIYNEGILSDQFKIEQCIPIDVSIDKDGGFYILDIGNMMPTNDESGRLLYRKDGKHESIIDHIIRPVHLNVADLNDDDKKEFIISSFGSTLEELNTGGLYIYSSTQKETELVWSVDLPGASKSIVIDFNTDGKLDILALFSQGRETIQYFENQGNFNFIQKELIEHNPLYGTNDFLLHDFNADGLLDIVTSNGDNGDYSQIFKPYHGIRIYLQKEKISFEEEAFFPLHGVSKMILHDFDQDQDQDLFALSMYPNLFEMPWQSLIYFEQKGNLKFTPNYIEESPSNQWVMLERYDADGDEREDIIVGSNRIIETNKPTFFDQDWNQQKTSLKVIENTSQ